MAHALLTPYPIRAIGAHYGGAVGYQAKTLLPKTGFCFDGFMKKLVSLCPALPLMLALAATLACNAVSGVSAGGALEASPSTISFSSVQTGTRQKQSVTLMNTGRSTLTITQAPVIFKGTTGAATNDLVLPLSLAAGQSRTFEVSVQPQSIGGFTGHMEFTTKGQVSPVAIGFTGTGVIPSKLITTPTSFSFGDVQIGTTKTQTATMLNTGNESLTLSAAAVSDASFNVTGLSLPLTLAPNQGISFAVQFAPRAGGSSNGNLSLLLSGTKTPVDAALSGTGVSAACLIATDMNLMFSSLAVGTTQTLTETLENRGGSRVTVSQAWISGTAFSMTGATLPVTLGPGETTSFKVTFAPKVKGTFKGSASFISDGSDPSLMVSFGGSARGTLGHLIVNPGSVNAGTVAVGQRSTGTGTLTAEGASVTITNANSGGSEFAISGLKFPVTISPGQSIKFAVTFNPETSGIASVNALFASNAENSPTTATFTGKGVAPQSHSVDLAWTPSASPDVTGYNVYRAIYGTSCGAYSRVGSSSNATYTDAEATGGMTYCYAATAVNSVNEESDYSRPVATVIPLP
jgi:Abnormal spindle-like microcephaly-assoc'd, ASPM-SPD-2-Hydin